MRHGRAWALVIASLFPVGANAMRQCPPEFGEKSPAFMMLGMAVLVAGGVAGVVTAWWIARRARGAWLKRCLLLAIAGVAMVAVWCVTLLLYLGVFVLPC